MKQYKLSHFARAAMLLAVLAMLAACEKPILAAATAATASTYIRPVAEVSISKE